MVKDLKLIQSQRNGSGNDNSFYVATCIETEMGRDIRLFITFETNDDDTKISTENTRVISPAEPQLAWRGNVYREDIELYFKKSGHANFYDLLESEVAK